ncbi:transcriptional Coactivator p15-domain-containing protein [Tirmania nivea]|nr:transcriptional Coactivator p15-domain-containing protein [Tirmania nivea]
MPPRKRTTKAKMDDDFIDDSPADAGPQTKRTKTTKDNKTTAKPKASPLKQPDTKKHIDNEGNPYWELGGRHRRVTLSKFKGSMLISIREHYEKDGQVLPGKKGISLSMEQFNAMMAILPQLLAALLKESGTEVVMPAFGNVQKRSAEVTENARAAEEEEEEEDMQMKEEENVHVKEEEEEGERVEEEEGEIEEEEGEEEEKEETEKKRRRSLEQR